LSPIRILIVDDFKDWRHQILSLFKTRPEWQVVAEAADGLEAVQKAEEFKPDLILLDIGLPNLNGIEAARRIRQLSPSSKIVFLSQDNDPDVVQTALGMGVQGYVHKADIHSDFFPAIQVALRDGQFVSRSLKDLTDASGGKIPHRHEVLFYFDDTVLLDRVSHFIAAALKSGNAAIVIATKSHRDGVHQRLKATGLDADGAIQQGAYISVDATDVLSKIMLNGLPDPIQFFRDMGGLVKSAAKAAKSEQPRTVIFGEAVALLLSERKVHAAIQFERFGNDLVQMHNADILCAYPLSKFQGKEDNPVFQSICAEHSAVHSQ